MMRIILIRTCKNQIENEIPSSNHLNQVDWLGQDSHPLMGPARFKHRSPETVVLLLTQHRVGKINVDPQRHLR